MCVAYYSWIGFPNFQTSAGWFSCCLHVLMVSSYSFFFTDCSKVLERRTSETDRMPLWWPLFSFVTERGTTAFMLCIRAGEII